MKNGKKRETKAQKYAAALERANMNQANEIKYLNGDNEYLRGVARKADSINIDLNSENAAQRKQLANAEQLRTAMYRGFAQERDEKYAEIYRLENRMRALGFELPDGRKAGV